MIRSIGLACVVAGGVLWGWSSARAQRVKVRLLADLHAALELMAVEAIHHAAPLPEAARHAAASFPLARGLLERFAAALTDGAGRSAAQAWRLACRQWPGTMQLEPAAQQALHNLAPFLGWGGAADHGRQLRLAAERLARHYERDEKDLDGRCRLWRYLGAGGGVIAALLLY